MRGNMRPKIKVRGYMANFRPFLAHIPPQFSPPTRIWPHSFPARGHILPHTKNGAAFPARPVVISRRAWCRSTPNADRIMRRGVDLHLALPRNGHKTVAHLLLSPNKHWVICFIRQHPRLGLTRCSGPGVSSSGRNEVVKTRNYWDTTSKLMVPWISSWSLTSTEYLPVDFTKPLVMSMHYPAPDHQQLRRPEQRR